MGIYWLLLLTTVATMMLSAPPAHAKCCELQWIEVTGGHLKGNVRIDAGELEDQIGELDFGLVYWPVFNNPFKGNSPPTERLGTAFEITYVLNNSEEDPVVRARERVYPFARPEPVAFTPKRQRQDFVTTDGRTYVIPWGWRPFPESATDAIFFDEPSGRFEDTEPAVSPDELLLGALGLTALVLVAGAVGVFVYGARHGRSRATEAGADEALS